MNIFWLHHKTRNSETEKKEKLSVQVDCVWRGNHSKICVFISLFHFWMQKRAGTTSELRSWAHNSLNYERKRTNLSLIDFSVLCLYYSWLPENFLNNSTWFVAHDCLEGCEGRESCWTLFDDGKGKQSDFVDLLSDERKYAISFLRRVIDRALGAKAIPSSRQMKLPPDKIDTSEKANEIINKACDKQF